MQHPNPSDHARHDTTLIAGHAAGDLTEIDRVRADALLTECGACGELRRDLVAIAAATRSVPAPATLTRDLRLAPEQANRLRRGSWLRGLLHPFGAASSPIRPIATAFTSLGLVGLVVGVTLSAGAGLAGGQAIGMGDARGPDSEAAPSAAAAAASDAPAPEGAYEVQTLRASDGTLYQVWVTADGTSYLSTTPPRAVAQGMRSAKPTGEEPASIKAVFGAANQGGDPVGGTPTRDARP